MVQSKFKEQVPGKRYVLVVQKGKRLPWPLPSRFFKLTGEPSRQDLLIAKLAHPDRGTACSGAEFLGKTGPRAKRALPAQEKRFQEHKDHVQGACQNAIRIIKGGPVM